MCDKLLKVDLLLRVGDDPEQALDVRRGLGPLVQPIFFGDRVVMNFWVIDFLPFRIA